MPNDYYAFRELEITILDGVYEKGVKFSGSEIRDLEYRLERSIDLNF